MAETFVKTVPRHSNEVLLLPVKFWMVETSIIRQKSLLNKITDHFMWRSDIFRYSISMFRNVNMWYHIYKVSCQPIVRKLSIQFVLDPDSNVIIRDILSYGFAHKAQHHSTLSREDLYPGIWDSRYIRNNIRVYVAITSRVSNCCGGIRIS